MNYVGRDRGNKDTERSTKVQKYYEGTCKSWGHRQSDEHWNRFKGNVGDISERRGGARKGFSERIDNRPPP